MIVLHANWSGGALCLWAETIERVPARFDPERASADEVELPETDEPVADDQPSGEAEPAVANDPQADDPEEDNPEEDNPEPDDPEPVVHPFTLTSDELSRRLGPALSVVLGSDPAEAARELVLRLPFVGDDPVPSARLAREHGLRADAGVPRTLRRARVEAVSVPPGIASRVLEMLDEQSHDESVPGFEQSVEYFVLASRFARRLLAQQRYVPTLVQDGTGDLQGIWQPWIADEQTAEEAAVLVAAMPASARAAVDSFEHEPRAVLGDFLMRLTDAACRETFQQETMRAVIDGRDTQSDPSAAWLAGLLGREINVPMAVSGRQGLVRDVRRWIGQLEERGASSEWRLCLRVNEPIELPPMEGEHALQIETASATPWTLSFHLQPMDGSQELLVDAADIWLFTTESVTIEGKHLPNPQELLLGELGRASRIYKPLERALSEVEPIEHEIATDEAYRFLREVRPVLIEQGFGVQAPVWWDTPTSRLGAKLLLDAPDIDGHDGSADAQLGLDALVGYQWQIAVGDTTLTLKQFEDLAGQKVPLVRINGKWVEIRPEDVEAAIRFIRENPGGQMKVGEAIRLAFGTDSKQTGIRVTGIEASGWLARVFSGEAKAEVVPEVPQPATFQGTLRPYQERGLAWLYFLEKFGFGACLADDMGLGKTIQLLALMAHEREQAPPGPDGEPGRVSPTLLVVPTSVVGNWVHESERFTPHLKVIVHHGSDRARDAAFVEEATAADLVVTTYALANRDQEMLGAVRWGRLVLDEAQYIKNAASKQSQAVRGITAERRVALTGTPVENRLAELWSLMDFLNPGYLGPAQNFRKRFGVPIERYNDQHKSAQLRGLVQPFVLRRLKTDPRVVSDLPPKVESREYAHLTTEQAELYEACVKRTLSDVEQAEGIRRRGVVLAALVKLKQICNHPTQALKEQEGVDHPPVPDPARSGKAARICEMLEEVLDAGDQALVFTQFRQMGHLLSQMLRKRLGRDILFLHGGTPRTQRQRLVEDFQRADGTNPVLLISLKAGGVGLNLTAANHVFHYDRWWNPAVENQATDRAYRIGQTRTVQVHKFVCRGTLEERIDQMLEQKMELAEQIIGTGEQWLTELDTDQLKELLSLREDAIGEG
ncbi:MAG: SNF2-related protein [Planctomycetota bacterium]